MLKNIYLQLSYRLFDGLITSTRNSCPVKNGKVYSSYEIERYVIDKWFFSCTNLRDYFYNAVEGLPTYGKSIYNTTKINRLKNIVALAKRYEQNRMPISAEVEIKKEI